LGKRVLIVAAGLWLFTVSAPASEDARRTPIVVAVEEAKDCVVNISTEATVLRRSPGGAVPEDPFDRLFEDFFRSHRYQRARVLQPLGSGVVLDERGLIVTNAHVIQRARDLRLSLADGAKYEGDLLAADFDNDVALLRIQNPRRNLKPIRMAQSPLMLGETVIALGNPYGLSNSVTSGIVSSLERDVAIGNGEDRREFKGLVQTSALINPGNSGGPLVNLDAELVGINTAIVDHAQGIGFAIPAVQLRESLAELLATPEVSSVWLGLSFRSNPLTVAGVAKDSPAAKAGLRANDRVHTFASRPARDAFDVGMALLYRRPGDRIEIGIERHGRRREMIVTLAEPKPLTDETVLSRRVGILGQDVDRDLARTMQLPVTWGILVAKLEPDSPADRAGIKVGDLIIQMGRYRIQSLRQAVRILRDARPGDRVSVALVRSGYLARTAVRIR